MLTLASATLDKLAKVPTSFWITAACVVAALIGLVIFVRFLRGMNKIVLAIIVMVILTVVGFSWIYERNEPAFLTPIIEPLSQFFPTKGAYKETQKKESGSVKDNHKTPPPPAPAKK
jgi:glucan phosphoethanolaminetransferase (alkaline phosphatase superfamily)